MWLQVCFHCKGLWAIVTGKVFASCMSFHVFHQSRLCLKPIATVVTLELTFTGVVAHVFHQIGFVHKTFSTDATYVRSHAAVSLHCVCFQISCLVETLTALLASKGLFLLSMTIVLMIQKDISVKEYLVNYHVFGESPPGGENSSTNRACLRLARARFMNSWVAFSFLLFDCSLFCL